MIFMNLIFRIRMCQAGNALSCLGRPKRHPAIPAFAGAPERHRAALRTGKLFFFGRDKGFGARFTPLMNCP